MPLREYGCGSCGLRFEKLISGYSPSQFVLCQCGRKAKLLLSVCSVVTSSRSLMGNPHVRGDVVVGHFAEKAWDQYEVFRHVKEPLRRLAKSVGTGLTVDPGQSCVRTMSAQELENRKDGLRLWAKSERERVRQPKGKATKVMI